MRCKACDRKIGEYDQYRRTVKDSHTGKVYVHYEDLCKRCRDAVYTDDTEDKEILGIFGYEQAD